MDGQYGEGEGWVRMCWTRRGEGNGRDVCCKFVSAPGVYPSGLYIDGDRCPADWKKEMVQFPPLDGNLPGILLLQGDPHQRREANGDDDRAEGDEHDGERLQHSVGLFSLEGEFVSGSIRVDFGVCYVRKYESSVPREEMGKSDTKTTTANGRKSKLGGRLVGTILGHGLARGRPQWNARAAGMQNLSWIALELAITSQQDDVDDDHDTGNDTYSRFCWSRDMHIDPVYGNITDISGGRRANLSPGLLGADIFSPFCPSLYGVHSCPGYKPGIRHLLVLSKA
ncbi:hypothetical protein MBM_03578 [Drepanopeziza brunnea f. sp. 'multigermtubi' MB_m1]|uniref:Uncharacterized protein n=1 Tax=Marssonina brunnea f. sp. multigermtubi (strain MB_m1) TaxID=1072389 RepID=K1WLJ9_MARBU|nr:uncharacterized protein MBM_03578 [Drepanopeziza brunnea f. sp. 'multigermtubi' MB_m1]EKD18585.1 hypothetical protein MBM_03578 [Drepanopeziza brunnea f. sp. 'multigermtubi' MB_m1]